MSEVLRAMDWFEFSGLVSGLLCVWLLIRQNVWTFPVGIFYVLVSLWVFLQARLYADLALHLVYLGLNAYGWWFWLRGGAIRSGEQAPIRRAEPELLMGLVGLSVLGTVVGGWLMARYTDASLPYWDMATTVLSLAAMWLTSRKLLQTWHFWLVVDVLATGIYLYKGLIFYTVLYLIYIGMAVVGFLAWQRELQQGDTTAGVLSLVMVGPESSGKTTLAEALARRLGVSGVDEQARAWLQGRAGYDRDDVLAIATAQQAAEASARRRAAASGAGLVVVDTDILVILVWLEERFGSAPAELSTRFAARRNAAYLLLTPDLPWQSDPQREHPAQADRERLFERYRQLLDEAGHPYAVIDGAGEERISDALAALARWRPAVG